jgi:hypothetical protein
MSDRQQHQQNRDQALTERTRAIAELIARCRRMTPEQFASQPASVMRRLDAEQFSAIVSHITGGSQPVKVPIDKAAPGPSGASTQSTRPRQPRSFLYRMTRTSLIGGTLASIGVTAVLLTAPLLASRRPIVRPPTANDWPMCRRLTASIDGCRYRVAHRLAWQDAARWLAIPEAELRRMNHAPGAAALQAGQHLIVWRGLGQLKP